MKARISKHTPTLFRWIGADHVLVDMDIEVTGLKSPTGTNTATFNGVDLLVFTDGRWRYLDSRGYVFLPAR